MKKLYFSLILTVLIIGIQDLKAQNYVDFNVDYFGECAPANVTFMNYSVFTDYVDTIYYQWYINGVPFSTDQYPAAMNLSGGHHHIELSAWDNGGGYWNNFVDIEITGLGNIITVPEEICPGDLAKLNIEGNADWVIWTLPDGTRTNDWNAEYLFDTIGVYTIKVLASTNQCGIDSASKEITVNSGAIPVAEIWTNGNYFCPNDEIKFNSPDAKTHMWIFKKGVNVLDTLYGQEIFYAFADTGMYNVALTVTNTCNNTNTSSQEFFIGSNAYPDAWFNINYGSETCPNYPIEFVAQSSGQYEWDFGDGSFAYDRKVYNTYSEPGTYNVTLINSNGCGNTDTVTQTVNIGFNPENIPGVDIRFKDKDYGVSTLNVCPNTEVEFEGEIWNSDDDIELSWYVNNTFSSHSENLIYNFTNHGFYEVKLVAINKCMGADSASRYINVDTMLMPVTELNIAPYDICPDEEVYFWDDGNHDNYNTDYIQKLSYNFTFGDGATLNNITKPTVEFPPVLVAHAYTTGSYDFIFTATNNCGNSDTLQGSITVDNNADRDPFYYVGNSTIGDNEEGQMEDWSMPSENAHKFDVPINLINWDYFQNMDSMLYVFLWYGNIDPMGDPGPPDGIVSVKAPTTATAYVPYNVINPSVGIAVVWYCDSGNIDSDPSLYALPTNTAMEEIQSFPLEKNGYTDLATYPDISGPLSLDGSLWDGTCMTAESKLRSRWYYQASEGYYVALGIWEEGEGMLKYDLSYGSDRWNTSSFVSMGDLEETSEGNLYFTQIDGQQCPNLLNFNYTYVLDEVNDELSLTNSSDTCSTRIDFLTRKPFIRDDDNNWGYDYQKDRTGCPGDSIELYIAGGTSYQWKLHDGTISTDAHFYHVYPDTGKYKELVIATNNCGRIDSIYTFVTIGNTNTPEAYWNSDKYDAHRMEPIHFWPQDNGDNSMNWNYSWNFGDGTTSTQKSPEHYYNAEGDYNVTLTISNGCGSESQSQTIWIKKELSSCNAKFTYNIIGDSIEFYNNSLGDITSYLWNFGDGVTSKLKNPRHTYAKAGIYEVSLIVYNSETQCSDKVSLMIQVGTIDCFANFKFQINETNQNVIFTDLSAGEIESWFWEFGDGTVSSDTLPVHNYPNPGVYPVCLTISNAAGCMSSICKELRIGNIEIHANFDYFIESETAKVTLSDNSEGEVTNWYWEFGDGNWDTIPNTNHTYSEPGEYQVCLGVYNKNTNAFDDICKDIFISDTTGILTKAKFNYMLVPGTNDVKFLDNSTGDITNWYWTFGDGTYASGDTILHSFPSPGFYTVCLTVFNSTTGKRSEICKTIQAGTISCNINAEFGYYINPATNEVSFNDKSTGTVNSRFWDFGDGKTSSKATPKHTYTKPGFYLVSLGVRDTLNNCTDYYADFIQVGSADCASDFTFTVTDLSKNEVKFIDKSTGDIGNWFWYFDDGTFTTDSISTHTYNSPGLYKVGLTVSDKSGLCMDYKIKDVQVGEINCDASFTAYIDSLKSTAYFTNSSIVGATGYYWLFGDGKYYIGTNPVHKYVAPGYYTVSLNTYNSTNDCMDYQEKVILIGNSSADVEANFQYQADLNTKKVTFSNKSLGESLQFIWDFGDGTTSTDENPTHQYTKGGYQFVCLTATNSITDAVKTTCKMILVSNESVDNCLAQFNYDVDTTNKKVIFFDDSYGDPDTYEWKFGDGTTSTDANPEHTYTAKDYYLVELRTFNSTTKCKSYTNQLINMGVNNDSIQAAFTYEIDTTSIGKPGGNPVDVWGTGHGGGARLSWNFGDGKVSNKAMNSTTLRPTHVYATGGKYTVCLTISDPVINQSDTYCDDVLVPYETFTTESICQGDTYDLFGESITTAGEYEGKTTTSEGVDSTVYLTLSINPVPEKPTISVSDNVLTATSATAYQWYKDDIKIDDATDQSYTATVSGNYTVIVFNESNCPSITSDAAIVSISGIEDFDKFNIEIYPNPMQNYTIIKYNLLQTSQINISLFDVSGNQVETLVNTFKPAGDNQIIWKDPGLANGIYYLVFRTDNNAITKKLVIQK